MNLWNGGLRRAFRSANSAFSIQHSAISASLVSHFLQPATRSSQSNAAARCANEIDEVLHLVTAEAGIALDLRERAAGIRMQEVPERTAKFRNRIGREFSAHQADGVQSIDARAIADGFRKRQRVLGDDREASDERVTTDTAELVYA